MSNYLDLNSISPLVKSVRPQTKYLILSNFSFTFCKVGILETIYLAGPLSRLDETFHAKWLEHTHVWNSSRVVTDSYLPKLNPLSFIFHSIEWHSNLYHKAVLPILLWKPNDGVCRRTL